MRNSPRFLVLLGLCSFVRFAAAADFVVLTSNDSGPGSLRDAIVAANAAPGADRIVFAIPGAGVQEISALSALPDITDELVIDGYTQPGAKPNSLETGNDAVILIHLDGTKTRSDCLTIKASNCAIRGLSITGFLTSNIFFATGGVAITVDSGSGNRIEGCFLGAFPDGVTRRPNGRGIEVRASATSIGGASPDKRNVISGNALVGLFVRNDGTTIAGNYIGTDASGTRAVPNATGIQLAGTHTSTVVGGTAKGSGNLVSANQIGIGVGVSTDALTAGGANGVVIQGNLVGTTANGADSLGNGQGIVVDGANNLIGGLVPGAGNVVAFNPYGAVTIRRGIGNRILSNAIYSTDRIAIDLGGNGLPLPNDIGDGDSGETTANNFQNFPTIDSVVIANSSAAISGNLNSTPNTAFTIQFFAESQSLTDSKQTYLGSTSVTTNGNGDASFTAQFPVPNANVRINATATSASGDTSEFFLNPGHFRNISTRGRIETGENVMIAGFILTSGAEIAVRAIAPSLLGNAVPDPLPDPVLDLYGAGGLLIHNDNWNDDSVGAAALRDSGLAPRHPLEAGTVAGLNAGVYTVVVRGKGNAAGTALVEVYDLSDAGPPAAGGNLANISTRGFVQTGDNVLIGGIMIGRGELPPRVVVRGIGPSLAQNGIANSLQDPTIELRDGNGILLFANDNWKESQRTELESTGLAPLNDAESAILTRLGPGDYTAILRGKNASTGVGLVELYRIP